MSDRPRAVVLGTELPRASAVVQSLGRAGIPILAVDHRLGMEAAASRYVGERVIRHHRRDPMPTKQSRTGEWLFSESETLDLLEALGRDGGGVLIPTNDEYLRVVATHHERLAGWFAVAAPPWSVLEPLVDRLQSYRLAESIGLEVPRHFSPRTLDEVRDVASSLDFARRAYLLKLEVTSPGPADPRSNAFTRPAGPDARSMIERCREILDRVGHLPLVQEVVPGGADRCVGVTLVLGPDGEPVLRYAVRRLDLDLYARGGDERHPYELGANVRAESVRDDEAIEAATALARRARIRGVATVEFRRHPEDGRLRFLKVDPRVVNATALSTALGLDVPTALYEVALGREPHLPREYPAGVAWLWLDRFARTLLANRDGHGRRALTALLRRLPRTRSVAYLDARDPRPFLRACRREWAHRRSSPPAALDSGGHALYPGPSPQSGSHSREGGAR